MTIVAGGSNGSVSAFVDVFNWTTGTLTPGPALSVARMYMLAAAAGSNAIFAGGYSASNVAVSAVDIYNASANAWSRTNLTVARYNGAGSSVGDVAVLMGGVDATGAVSAVVDIYNAALPAAPWNSTALLSARRQMAAATIGKLAVISGGLGASATAGDDVWRCWTRRRTHGARTRRCRWRGTATAAWGWATRRSSAAAPATRGPTRGWTC